MPDVNKVAGQAKLAGKSWMKKILVVDDDPLILDGLKKYLSMFPLKVDTASNGLDALSAIGSDNFDLLLTDYNMSKMDGLALVKEVRKNHPNIAILVMTSEPFRELFTGLGIAGFFAKPLDLACLRDAISGILQTR